MKPPDRRQGVTITLDWCNSNHHLTFNKDDETGEIIEVFVAAPKPGSGAWALANDLARSFSLEIQDGTPPAEFAARAIRDGEGRPLSLYGVIADALVAESMGLLR